MDAGLCGHSSLGDRGALFRELRVNQLAGRGVNDTREPREISNSKRVGADDIRVRSGWMVNGLISDCPQFLTGRIKRGEVVRGTALWIRHVVKDYDDPVIELDGVDNRAIERPGRICDT
jgi:hypothetical protein